MDVRGKLLTQNSFYTSLISVVVLSEFRGRKRWREDYVFLFSNDILSLSEVAETEIEFWSEIYFSSKYILCYESKYKMVGVLPMRIVWSNVSSIGPSSERNRK